MYSPGVQLRFGAATDPGLVRPRNEDRYIADSELGLFAVVDGMGGHAGGELASETIAEAVTAFIRETAGDSDKTWPGGLDPRLSVLANRLQIAIRSANLTLATRAKANAALDGSGATLAAALFGHGELAVSNVGDCRAYLLRDGHLSQITRDHSIVAEQLALGLIDSETARTHPLRHVVTRAVSGQAGMPVDIFELKIQRGDRLILCSDGIHAVLSDAEIVAIVSADGRTTDEACRATIDAANARGGPDNATTIVVEAL
ncbi:MAG: serine/threonine-protein phosphatase [Acidobacteria bacterium]|nr:serine/threonine-protein phosphatase [Acidobacteriota bacterium]